MNNIRNIPSPPHTISTVFTIVFLTVVSNSVCNIHIIETPQPAMCPSELKNKTCQLLRGRAGCMIRVACKFTQCFKVYCGFHCQPSWGCRPGWRGKGFPGPGG